MSIIDIELTKVSEEAFANILYGRMTPQMAADYLRTGATTPRSFSQTLRAFCPNGDILALISTLYQAVDPKTNPRSLTKKLQNWLSDRNTPTDREDYFRIAFALHLDENQLDYLLSMFTDYGIQYRNSRDLVLSWFLRGGHSYFECRFVKDVLHIGERGKGL